MKFSRHLKSIAVISLIIVILASPFIYRLYLMPSKELNISVLDKTVAVFQAETKSYTEHYSLFWVLEHHKVIPRTSTPGGGDRDRNGHYEVTDYFGYDPVTESSTGVLDMDLDPARLDVLYLADTFGVLKEFPNGTMLRVAGGWSLPEAQAVSRYAEKGGGILAEWNILGYPTYLNASAENVLAKVLHFHSNGYGKHYLDLDKVEDYYKDLYLWLYGKEWNYEGEGIMIVLEFTIKLREQNTEIIVLESKDLKLEEGFPIMLHIDSEHPAIRGVDEEYPYGYWFEIITPDDQVDLIGYYELRTSDSGTSKLEAHDISLTPPAIMTYDGNYRLVYFAGDFTDYPDKYPNYLLSYVPGSEIVIRTFSRLNPPWTRFFWRFYEPTIPDALEWLSER